MFVRVFAPGKSPRPHRDARAVVFCFVLLFSRLAPRGMRAALPKGPVGRNVSPIGNHTSREREGEKKSAAITMWRFDSSSVRIYFIFPCRRLRCRSRGAFFSFSYFKIGFSKHRAASFVQCRRFQMDRERTLRAATGALDRSVCNKRCGLLSFCENRFKPSFRLHFVHSSGPSHEVAKFRRNVFDSI